MRAGPAQVMMILITSAARFPYSTSGCCQDKLNATRLLVIGVTAHQKPHSYTESAVCLNHVAVT